MASKRERVQQSQKTTKDPLPNLPHEIIVEILCRIPVSSLLQFRCVCKSWRDLVSDPQFVKSHLNISSKTENYDRTRIVLSSSRPHFYLKSCSIQSALYDQPVNAVEPDYPLKDPHNSVWIVGCCNGLVCISIEEDDLFIWNPATRKSLKLPNSGMRSRFGCFMIYGFGYDEFTDDYVVVGVFCVVGSGESYDTEVKLYTRRTHFWRRIQNFSCGIPLHDSGRFANGALHWASSCNNASNYSWVIVSLDLRKETYAEVAQPNYGDGEFGLTLGVLDGCLCVHCDFRDIRSDIWVMKEYGVRESWCKLVSIPYQMGYGNSLYSPPICISKNGEVLLLLGMRLIMYNSRDSTFRIPLIPNFDGCLEADTYVESLVSPTVN